MGVHRNDNKCLTYIFFDNTRKIFTSTYKSFFIISFKQEIIKLFTKLFCLIDILL